MKKLLLVGLCSLFSLSHGMMPETDLDEPLLGEVELRVLDTENTPPSSPSRETEPGQTPEKEKPADLNAHKELTRLAKIQEFVKHSPKIQKLYSALGHNVTRSFIEIFISGLIFAIVLKQDFGSLAVGFGLHGFGSILGKHLGLNKLYMPGILKPIECAIKAGFVYGLYKGAEIIDQAVFIKYNFPLLLATVAVFMGFESQKEVFHTKPLLGNPLKKLSSLTKRGLTKLGWKFEEQVAPAAHEIDIEAADGRKLQRHDAHQTAHAEEFKKQLTETLKLPEFKETLRALVADFQATESSEVAAAAQE